MGSLKFCIDGFQMLPQTGCIIIGNKPLLKIQNQESTSADFEMQVLQG